MVAVVEVAPAAPVMRPSRWRNADRWLVGLCSLVVAIVSMWGLASRSLWRDEASTWAISGHGLGELVRALVHSEAEAGGLYLVLQYGWLHVFGDSEVGLRSMSVVLAVACVPVFFAVARRILGRRGALVATVLLSLNPFFLAYAREARMYALALLLSIASSYWFVRLLSGDASRASLVAYVVAASAAFYAHPFAILVVVAQACSLALLPGHAVPHRILRRAFAATLVLDLPLFAFALTRGQGVGWITPLTLGQFTELAASFTGSTHWIAPVFMLLVATTGVVLCVRVAIGAGRSTELWQVGFPFLWWASPIVATVIVSLFVPFLVPRYLLIALPGYALTLGSVLDRIGRRSRPIVAAVVMIVIIAISVPAIDKIWGAAASTEDWRGAVELVAERYAPGDSVVFPGGEDDVRPFGYYAARDPRLAATRPITYNASASWTMPYVARYVPPRGNGLLPGRSETGRLWIVHRGAASEALSKRWGPPLDQLRRDLERPRACLKRHAFRGVTVYQYTPSVSTRCPQVTS
jgi:mannosyltransferase